MDKIVRRVSLYTFGGRGGEGRSCPCGIVESTSMLKIGILAIKSN